MPRRCWRPRRRPIAPYWSGPDPCEVWPYPATGVRERITAEGAAPIVVVGTTNDPATPYEWSVSLAEQLSSGVLVTRVGEGHTGYNKGNACVDSRRRDLPARRHPARGRPALRVNPTHEKRMPQHAASASHGGGTAPRQRRSTRRASALPMNCTAWTITMMTSTAAHVTHGLNCLKP